MKPKLFLDTNVVIDFFMEREPFTEDAVRLFELKESGKVDLCLSALTVANLAYHVNKRGKNPFILLKDFLDWIEVIDLDKNIFCKTIDSDFDDFEDGLQYFSAVKSFGVDVIITRNIKDFKPSLIPVYTPSDYLKEWEQ